MNWIYLYLYYFYLWLVRASNLKMSNSQSKQVVSKSSSSCEDERFFPNFSTTSSWLKFRILKTVDCLPNEAAEDLRGSLDGIYENSIIFKASITI